MDVPPINYYFGISNFTALGRVVHSQTQFARHSGHAPGVVLALLVFLLAPGTSPGTTPRPAPPLCKPLAAHAFTKTGEPAPRADDRGYDVQRYELELRLDPAGRRVSGQVMVHFTALRTLATVELDLVPEMAVTALGDGTGPLPYVHQDERLTVTLRTALAPGRGDSLLIDWNGQPPRHGAFALGLMFRTHDAGTPTDPADDVPIVASMSQPWSAHSWWPCKDHPADKALVGLAVTVPDSLSAVSNGRLLAVTATEPGWRRYAWRSAYPLPTYLVSVAASDYVAWSENCTPATGPPVRLDFHVFPPDSARAAVDLAPSCDMFRFLVERLGPWPYPGEKYAQVEFKWIGAMEHTTATSIAQLAFTGDGRFENLILHEMAHQWLGDSLTPATWADIWLNEGFARYAEALWVEHRQGTAAFREFMGVIGARGHPDLFVGDGTLAAPDPILPNELVYDKGAWVLHMLRGLIGDEAFFAFLGDYASAPDLVHGLTTTSRMIAAAEAAAGRSLDAFFNPWLATDAVPLLSREVRAPANGPMQLTLTQQQEPLFQLPVPVVIHTGCGETRLTVPLTGREQTWSWEFDCRVDSVRIDPEGYALLRLVDAPPPPLTVRGPVPQPVGAGGATFELFLTSEAQVTATTYDLRGSNMGSRDLGTVAATGAASETETGYEWTWLPIEAGSRPLPAGLYFVEFRAGSSREVRRAVLVR